MRAVEDVSRTPYSSRTKDPVAIPSTDTVIVTPLIECTLAADFFIP